ncbi:hypothetical protein GCM10010321_12920 [Streptomyces chartreusis]|nr:hypothetical protein GCM10010321_12920 [Streptomyces chartreusis]
MQLSGGPSRPRAHSPLSDGSVPAAPGTINCRECRGSTAHLGRKTDVKDGYADHTCHHDAQSVERHR